MRKQIRAASIAAALLGAVITQKSIEELSTLEERLRNIPVPALSVFDVIGQKLEKAEGSLLYLPGVTMHRPGLMSADFSAGKDKSNDNVYPDTIHARNLLQGIFDVTEKPGFLIYYGASYANRQQTAEFNRGLRRIYDMIPAQKIDKRYVRKHGETYFRHFFEDLRRDVRNLTELFYLSDMNHTFRIREKNMPEDARQAMKNINSVKDSYAMTLKMVYYSMAASIASILAGAFSVLSRPYTVLRFNR